MRSLLIVLLAAVLAVPALAQPEARSLYNQDRLAALFYANRDSLDTLPEVTYRYHVVDHEWGVAPAARSALYLQVGDGDADLGRRRLTVPAFLNGITPIDDRGNLDLQIGDRIVLPSHYDLDVRAYSPFPRYYEGARALGKLFIIHKSVQAWAAYEHGRLTRWGLVSTGADGSETPNGRFNFNWRERYRVSTLSPPGERWEMRWVFNFHDARGIHVHQYYALPTGGAASHGCVRLMTADAQWIYDWADGWVTTNGTADGAMASRGRVLRQGTMVLVLGRQPAGAPQRFRDVDGRPELVRVDLPADPYSVAPGTDQQRHFDRLRAQQQPRSTPAPARARRSS